MPLAAQGGPATVDALVRNGAGQPVDPIGLTLEIRDLGGVLVDGPHSVPPIVRTALGRYVYTWAVPDDQPIATYEVTWLGIDPTTAETVYGADRIDVVAPGYIGTGLTFLSTADYDGVRHLLGVTDLDVTNDVIESLPFGQHAELRVKTSDPDWASVVPGSTAWEYLRTATAYGAAALIAESFAKGGMVSLAHGPGTGARTAADWDKVATTLWAYFPRLIQAAEELESGVVTAEPKMYDFRLLHHSGPTSARIASSEATDLAWTLDLWDPMFLGGYFVR
ncbi:MAG: hypothetical protein ACOYB2_10575 [Limnohabitans sp.]